MRTIFHDFSEDLFCFHRVYSDQPDADWKLPDGLKNEIQHFHAHYELTVTIAGQVNLLAGAENRLMNGPCVILHAPYSFHMSHALRDVPYECYVFHFSRELAESFDARYFNLNAIYANSLTVIPADEFRDELFARLSMWRDGEGEENAHRLLLVTLLELVGRHMNLALAPAAPASKQSYIYDVVKYISSHYSEPLSADDLSREFFVSRQKLDADFKSVMNTTLKQYILDIRTAEAVRMLSLGNKPSDVTYACGFVSESHFIRSFTQRIGVSPSKFAKTTGAVSDWDAEE